MLKADGLAEREELGSNPTACLAPQTKFSGPEGRTTTISRGALAPEIPQLLHELRIGLTRVSVHPCA